MRKKLTRKQQKYVDHLNREIHDCEWKEGLLKNCDPDLAYYWKFKALQFRLKMYEQMYTVEKYKELYKHWVKGVVLPEEYAKIDDYFLEKYGV